MGRRTCAPLRACFHCQPGTDAALTAPLYDAATGAPFQLTTDGAKAEEPEAWLALAHSCPSPKLRKLSVLDSAEYSLQRTGTERL